MRAMKIVLALGVLAGSAGAGVRYDLFIFENADGVDTSGIDVWVEVDDIGGGQVSLTWGNDSLDGDVTTIYVENNNLLSGGTIVDNADVEYSAPGTPPNPPGSINGFFGGAWAGNLFNADPDNPGGVANSLNPGESFAVNFDLVGGATFNEVVNALTGDPATFRVAAHIQRIGAGDASIWGVNPTPGTAAPIAIAGLFAARRRRA